MRPARRASPFDLTAERSFVAAGGSCASGTRRYESARTSRTRAGAQAVARCRARARRTLGKARRAKQRSRSFPPACLARVRLRASNGFCSSSPCGLSVARLEAGELGRVRVPAASSDAVSARVSAASSRDAASLSVRRAHSAKVKGHCFAAAASHASHSPAEAESGRRGERCFPRTPRRRPLMAQRPRRGRGARPGCEVSCFGA